MNTTLARTCSRFDCHCPDFETAGCIHYGMPRSSMSMFKSNSALYGFLLVLSIIATHAVATATWLWQMTAIYKTGMEVREATEELESRVYNLNFATSIELEAQAKLNAAVKEYSEAVEARQVAAAMKDMSERILANAQERANKARPWIGLFRRA